MSRRRSRRIRIGDQTLQRWSDFRVETDRFAFLKLFAAEWERLRKIDPGMDPALLLLGAVHGVFDLLEERYPSEETLRAMQEA